MAFMDQKLKKMLNTLNAVDDEKACEISLDYLREMKNVFINVINLVSSGTDVHFDVNIQYDIFCDLYLIFSRLEQIDNITSSRHILKLIEINLDKIYWNYIVNNISFNKMNEELFHDYMELINNIQIIVLDIFSFLNDGLNITDITFFLNGHIRSIDCLF